MNRKELYFIIACCVCIISLFFYKTIIKGYIPFPGDILVSEFQPWRSSSYLGYDPGGIPNKAQYPDTIRQMYPWKTLAVNALKKGNLPLWNPYNFSGAPLLANFQNAALYPLGIFYVFFNQINAWTLLIMLQPFLALLFTYVYCRKIGLSFFGSLLASLSYGFSGFMSVWLEYNTVGHVILWLPLILYTIELTNVNKRWFFILSIAYSASFLAGHPQVFGYLFIFSLVYGFLRTKHKLLLFVYAFLGVGIAGIQLIPGIELIKNAARSHHDFSTLFEKILIQPWQLVSAAFPNFFGNPASRNYWPSDTFVGKVTTIGLVPLFFLLSAFRKKNWFRTFYLNTSILILLLVSANPLTYILYQSTSNSPTLMTFLLSFSLSILSGIGFDHFIVEKHTVKKLIRRSIQIGVLLVALLLFTKAPATRAIMYAGVLTIFTLVCFWLFITTNYKKTSLILLVVIHIFDLFYFFNKFNPFVPREFIFPDHEIITYLKDKQERFWGYGTARIDSNFSSQYAIYSPEGYDPLYPKWYGEFLYSYKNDDTTTFDDTTRSDASIESHFGDGGLSDKSKHDVLNALSVRYILDKVENSSVESMFPGDSFRKIHEYRDWIIYENTKANPRVSLTNGVAEITSYLPEQVIIHTESTVSGTLTLTDSYYPGWVANVDGVDTVIQKTNNAMRAIAVPEGKHRVIMNYLPKSLFYGIAISIISFISVVFIILVV